MQFFVLIFEFTDCLDEFIQIKCLLVVAIPQLLYFIFVLAHKALYLVDLHFFLDCVHLRIRVCKVGVVPCLWFCVETARPGAVDSSHHPMHSLRLLRGVFVDSTLCVGQLLVRVFVHLHRLLLLLELRDVRTLVLVLGLLGLIVVDRVCFLVGGIIVRWSQVRRLIVICHTVLIIIVLLEGGGLLLLLLLRNSWLNQICELRTRLIEADQLVVVLLHIVADSKVGTHADVVHRFVFERQKRIRCRPVCVVIQA